MIFIFQENFGITIYATQNIIENYISINKQMINKIKNKISDIDSEKSWQYISEVKISKAT